MPFAGERTFVARVRMFLALLGGFLLLCCQSTLRAADIDDARQEFRHGNYSHCIRLCKKAIADQEYDEEWRLLLIQSMMTVGQYANALSVLATNLERYPSSLRLRLLGREVYFYNEKKEKADALVQEINFLVRSRTWAYRSAEDLVTVGKAALLMGIDPREVLDQLFDKAKKADAGCRDVYLAEGEVALDKGDYALAAKGFQEGLKKFPDDPEFHYGLARAYAVSDRKLMLESVESALSENTNHVPSYLLLADHLVDAEEYASADKTLEKVLSVNPWQPEAWAYLAVLAHLRNDADGERTCREKALRFWKTNPHVDFLIGQKLSKKYRFVEGAAAQRLALEFDKDYLPSKIQLAQDLLRLGEERDGWALAEEVQRTDGYDVTAYNLGTLHDSMVKFQTLTNEDFIVRMSKREAAIYGKQVLELLEQAKTNLCAKYGVELPRATVVEIFHEQKDFGVRTFGMPGNPGYLGVCFGNVITANSPASQSHPANWQAVLWHEFCHVVTLNLTHNKMPRWLSEGISVYEEKQANPVWGQAMNARYREMVLGKDLVPVGQLSGAFLAPKTDLHLQFAYFESSLVVEFLAGKFGLDSLKQILIDLGNGIEINQAIAAHTAPMAEIEKDFTAFARERAQNLAPGLDFQKPEGATSDDDDPERLPELRRRRSAPGRAGEASEQWVNEHPTNYYALNQRARTLLVEKKFTEAKTPLQKLIKLYPDDTSPDNARKLLAAAHRHLNETNLEREVLTELAAAEADDLDTFLRLTELCSIEKDWSCAAQNAERFVAVNPLLAEPYRYLATASEALDKPRAAIQAYSTMLLLDPADPAEAHFRLARLLQTAGDPAAKRHVLQALEEAPRFRDAHKLLLKITSDASTNAAKATNSNPIPNPKANTANEP